jgi:Tfp pilus assembly protein FimT
MKFSCFNRFTQAFTLSEVFIVLAIMGVLSTLLLPSFFESQTRKSCAYVIKSSILASNSVLTEAFDFSRTNLMNEAVERLTTIRNCGGTVNTATTGGCWNTASQGVLPANVANEGIVLKNNAVIVGFDSTVQSADQLLFFEMDANGVAGPNVTGVDQINLVTCTTEAFCQANETIQALTAQGFKAVPGELFPVDAASVSLYDRAFERI